MQSEALDKIPVRVKVDELVSSRYYDGKRPQNWDLRKAGHDFVKTSDGKLIKLASDGGQSPPKKGWVLLVSKGDPEAGYEWTLYGMPR